MGYFYSDEYLEHHGIKGQKWGIRRFQNYDGTRKKNAPASTATQPAKKGLTDEQKANLKKAAKVAATLAAVYGTYKVASIVAPVAKQKVSDLIYSPE